MNEDLQKVTDSIEGRVTLSGGAGHVRNATVELLPLTRSRSDLRPVTSAKTDANGMFTLLLPPGAGDTARYRIKCEVFGIQYDHPIKGLTEFQEVRLPIGFSISQHSYHLDQATLVPALRTVAGRAAVLRAELTGDAVNLSDVRITWSNTTGGATLLPSPTAKNEAEFTAFKPGAYTVQAEASVGGEAQALTSAVVQVGQPDVQMVDGHMNVTMQRTKSYPTLDEALWVAINDRTYALSFHRYRDFINRILLWEENEPLPKNLDRILREAGANLHGITPYNFLKLMTESFLVLEAGVRISDRTHNDAYFKEFEASEGLVEFTREQMQTKLREYLGPHATLPYIQRVIEAAFPDYEREGVRSRHGRFLRARINEPLLLELIWSYWLEEGMLMQTMNALALRFQNVRQRGDGNRLANIEIDNLRPMANILWGYVQDEPNRLSVARRAYEYQHQYGLVLFGRATSGLKPAAENRSKFLEAFHNLLYHASVFYKEDFQTTVIADGFPLLHSLQEVHLKLAESAQNQWQDLTWTARVEMMLAQYLLARPEIRDFLQSPAMVPYREAWMPQVDTMKTIQGWSDVSVTYFRDLAFYGEQLLLSARFGNWMDVNNEDSAKNWARFYRPAVQGYLHAYRIVAAIDLTNPDTVDATMPGVLLQKRLAQQHQRTR